MNGRFVVGTRIVKVAYSEGVGEARDRVEYLPDLLAVSDEQFARDILMARKVFRCLFETIKPTLDGPCFSGLRVDVDYFRLEWVAVLSEMSTYSCYRLRPRLVVKLSLVRSGTRDQKLQEVSLLVCFKEPIPDDFLDIDFRELASIMLDRLFGQLLEETRSMAVKAEEEAQAQQGVWEGLAAKV